MHNMIQQALDDHTALLKTFAKESPPILEEAAQALCNTFEKGGHVYICGNGGSAADAQHIAGELAGRFVLDRRALPAVALTTDTSLLTAVGNDYSYEDIFSRQVEALVQQKDLLWAFSTSGTSANVIKAAQRAKDRKATVLAFTGRAHSPLEALSDICLCAAHSATARSQEIHELAYHILCGLVEQHLFGDQGIGSSI